MPRQKSIQSRRPKTEFRKTAPVTCEFEIGGEIRSIDLKLTQQSYNELARSDDAGKFEAILGGLTPEEGETRDHALIRVCGVWGLLRMVPALIHAATGHLPDSERPTIEEISGSISDDNRAYYNEVFGMLLNPRGHDSDDEENPTNAGKPANGVTSSISTGREESPKLDFSSGLPSENLPN